MICKLLYSPQYDQLMIAVPLVEHSHWYRFWNDPWDYEGCVSHKMDFLRNVANFEVVDQWEYTSEWAEMLGAQ